jgi:hypothetical protein
MEECEYPRSRCTCKLKEPVEASSTSPVNSSQAEYLANSYTQVSPSKNSHPYIKDLVSKDFQERAEFGYAKYGTYLQPHNGRDVLKDLYQELMDSLIYTRQLIYERDGK